MMAHLDNKKAAIEADTNAFIAKLQAKAAFKASDKIDPTVQLDGMIGVMNKIIMQLNHMQQSNQQVMQAIQQLMIAVRKPKHIVRDQNGDIAAIQ